MKEDIESKLRKCFELKDIFEKDAVYFLVELYKLIESHEVKEKFPAIVFYRNWAVHVKISHKSDFKSWLAEVFNGIHMPENKIRYEVFSFAYFDILAKEIISFWHTYIDDREMKGTDSFFIKFRSALTQVIADIPILLEYDGEKVQLSFGKEGSLVIKGPGEHTGTIHAI